MLTVGLGIAVFLAAVVSYYMGVQRARKRGDALLKEQSQILDTFKAMSAEVLNANSQAFFTMAKAQFEGLQDVAKKDFEARQSNIHDLVKPVRESLERVDHKIQEMEKARARADETVFQQVRSLLEAQKDLRSETTQLVAALRAPQARGRWGEIQLKRVVEMAGMLEFCDFVTQASTNSEDGRLRPDLIVRLPGGKRIVVDAKAPLMAFLDALQVQTPEAKIQKLAEHSRHVRRHIEQLSRKAYWDQFNPAPEFVVLFMPGEHFFGAALEQDPSLIEAGVSQNVILATPTTLIALLRSVAYGWRQEKLTENARVMGELGRDLYKRISDMSVHFARTGKALEAATDSYNKTVGSLETRVLVSARKFKELGAATTETLETLPVVDQRPRILTAPELQSSSSSPEN